MKKLYLYVLVLLSLLFVAQVNLPVKAEASLISTGGVAVDVNNDIIPDTTGQFILDRNYSPKRYIYKLATEDKEYTVLESTLPNSFKTNNKTPDCFFNVCVISGYWYYYSQVWATDINNNIIPNSIGQFEYYNSSVVIYKYLLTDYSYINSDIEILNYDFRELKLYINTLPKEIKNDTNMYSKEVAFGVYNQNWSKSDKKLITKKISVEHYVDIWKEYSTQMAGVSTYNYFVYLNFDIPIDSIVEYEYYFAVKQKHKLFGFVWYNNEIRINCEPVKPDEVIKLHTGFWFWEFSKFYTIEKGEFFIENNSKDKVNNYSWRIAGVFQGRINLVYFEESYHSFSLDYQYNSVTYSAFLFNDIEKDISDGSAKKDDPDSFWNAIKKFLKEKFKDILDENPIIVYILCVLLGLIVLLFIMKIIEAFRNIFKKKSS